MLLLLLEVLLLFIILLAFLKIKQREALQVRRQQERQAFTRSLPVQIVCGDCMGDEMSPRRTFLGMYERCSRCGGNSYVLASALAANVRLYQLFQALQMHSATNDSRVVSMEEHRATRDDRNRKIAV